MITKTCLYCGKQYQTYPSIKPKYCSRDCANKAKIKGKFANCEQCGKPYWKLLSKPNRRFCSRSCAATARNLTDANPAYHRDISGKNNPMYGVRRTGKDNPMYGRTKANAPRWKGGKKTRKDGYIFVVVDNKHPYPSYVKSSGTKYILEHRLIMEQHIGRYLRPEEVVHHKDSNPQNNSIDNLELFSSQSEHIKVGHSDS